MMYKVYVTDLLKGLYKGLGGEAKSRYYDLITHKAIDGSRTADEIINDIREKIVNFSVT